MADVLVGAPSRPKIQIVPVRGLPIVAVVIAGLVVTIATNKLWPLEFYHVVGGGMWTALDLFLGLVLGPIIKPMPSKTVTTSFFTMVLLAILSSETFLNREQRI